MMNSYINRPDLYVKHELQENFKNENFRNVRISNIIASNITQSYLSFRKKKFKIAKELSNIFYLIFIRDLYVFVKFYFKIKKEIVSKDQIIIEAISDESRLRGFWLAIAKKYDRCGCLIITEDFDVYYRYNTDFNVIIPYKFDCLLWIKSRFYILLRLFKFYRLAKVQDNYTHFFALRVRIVADIIYQINNVVKADKIVNDYKPSSFLTIWDLYPIGAVFCNVFSSYKLPSITFIHGAVGIKSLIEFIPLNADYIISWGKYNTNLLISNGINSKNILESGCPRMTEYIPSMKVEVNKDKSSFNIELERKVICFLNTAIIRDRWMKDVSEIFNLLSLKYDFFCRPHPSNSRDLISLTLPPSLKVVWSDQLSLEKSIEMSDYLITDSSSAGFDALFMKKLVFVLDTNTVDVYQDVMYDACKEGAAVFCKSIDELLVNINRYTNDKEYKLTIKENQTRFVSDFISSYGEESALIIKNSLDQIAKK